MRTGDEDLENGGLRDPEDFPESGLSRRTLLRTAGAASMVLPAMRAGEAQGAARAGGFFNKADLAMVDELAEMIIPADAHSPGARAAGVAAEIDRRLAELFGPDPLTPPRRRQ